VDEAAFLRIVNVPPRQIGPKAIQALATWAAGVNAQTLAAEMSAAAEVRMFTCTARHAPPLEGLARRSTVACVSSRR
jgi:superfamily I DNA/RNA helicase